MKRVNCTIKGVSPLLMHRFPLIQVEGMEKKPPEEQAEIAAYRDEVTKSLYVPGVAVQRMLVAAAAFSKGKGQATLAKVVAACVFVAPEQCDLGVTAYSIDTRPVVIKSTGGRVPRHRPRFNDWSITFQLDYDETLLTEKQLRRVVDDAGQRVGLLDFRPACKGSFGRFMVTSWENM